MKQPITFIIIITFMILFSLSAFSETYVLIMGASDYRYDGVIPLPAAKKDALLMKESLIQLGIASEKNITYIENPVLTDIRIGLKEFLKNLEEHRGRFFLLILRGFLSVKAFGFHEKRSE